MLTTVTSQKGNLSLGVVGTIQITPHKLDRGYSFLTAIRAQFALTNKINNRFKQVMNIKIHTWDLNKQVTKWYLNFTLTD